VTDPDGAYLPPEARARIKIDRQLKNAGWVVQHVHQVNLTAGSGVAVREFVLEPGHGRVDYLLFVDGQPTGVIEAKPEGTTLIEVEHQSGKYITGLPAWLSGHSGTACRALERFGPLLDAPRMTSLVDRLLPKELWLRIQPLLPPVPPRPRGGVPRRIPDRNCVAALIFMARTSTPWALLPARELGCGSPSTCWRRLDEWARAGVFDQLQAMLLDELGAAGRIDLDRVSVDSFSLRAVKGGT
jgi:transposase